jgi:hypothetical protein
MMACGAARIVGGPLCRERIRMSHSHHGGHEGIQHGASAAAQPFTPAEIEEFQRSDRQAGGAVIVLMTAIFTIGVLLYGAIDYLITS